MMKRAGIVFPVLGLLVAASVAQAQDAVIKPQQTFEFMPDSYGCVSKEKLDSVYGHAQASEQQQMQAYFSGFQCVLTPENSQFRVLRVVGHDVEFVNAGNNDTEGLWTNDRFIKQ